MIPLQIKRIVALVLSAIIISSTFTVQSYAEDLSPFVEGDIVLEYENVLDASSTLSILGQTAYCDSTCSSYSNVIQISASITLQKFWGLWVWNDVNGAQWTKSESGSCIGVSKTKSGLSNGTYRLKSVFTVTTSDGQTETSTIYSPEKTIR